MAIVMTRIVDGVTVNIHDDCLIKDPEEIKRRINVCKNIMLETLARVKREQEEKEAAEETPLQT